MMPAAEYRYLVSALETPEGQRPQTWAEAEAYARAWGADRYDNVRHTQQIEQDRELLQAPAYAVSPVGRRRAPHLVVRGSSFLSFWGARPQFSWSVRNA